jgi:tRNA(Ile)-lysidine synthase
MGPHPAVAEVRRAVRLALGRRPRRGGDGACRVLVACSGGADSLALAAATAFEAPRAGIRAGLVTVDHGLQQGSAERASSVAALGRALGLEPVAVLPVSVGAAGGPEAAARSARYDALSVAAATLDADVLLGHTLDDQAETVLLGLGRGSGPRSIAGMRSVTADGWGRVADASAGCECPAEGVAAGAFAASRAAATEPDAGRLWIRPLLGVRRRVTEAACAALGLQPWRDPHNADPSFQRVRLRHEVLPLLEEVLQGGVVEALARTAALVRDDLDALDQLARNFLDQQRESGDICPELSVDHGSDLDVASLRALPRAVRTRVLRSWAQARGSAALSAGHTAALDALVTDWHGQGPLCLPGGLEVARASGKLVAQPAKNR